MNKVPNDHLLPEVRALLSLPLEDKVAFLKKRLAIRVVKEKSADSVIYIPRKVYDDISEEMKDSFLLAKEKSPCSCLAMAGPPGTGKSEFIRQWIAEMVTKGLCKSNEVLWFDIERTSGQKRLYEAILAKLGVMYNNRDNADELLRLVLDELESRGVKMLIIDEFHNLLAGDTTIQETLNAVKYMYNNSTLAIVLAGTPRIETLIKADTDGEMEGRFPVWKVLKWEAQKSEDDELYEDYINTLNLLEMWLPLPEPSRLSSATRATMILEWSHGVPRYVFLLVKGAAIIAIKNNSTRIRDEDFERAKVRLPFLYSEDKGEGKPEAKS